MSKIMNLRTIRKQRARDAARRDGSGTAAKAGESRADKTARRLEAERAARQLDGHRRSDGDGGESGM
ncbi:DUF4169 family protein [Rhodobacteraceae bacterium DSL-40]|uniref:DUF4169 family protein n=1 Tax=Amaricoccus sp. B4 TaxID=3368557 RepID=UPI000DAE2DBA